MARILVIDDDELIRITLRNILQRAGYEVTLATNGQDGLKKFRERPADLVILDIIMPEKGGIEVLGEFRRDAPEAKIIAISGGVMGRETDYLAAPKELGADHCLAKPVRPRDLLEAVARFLPR